MSEPTTAPLSAPNARRRPGWTIWRRVQVVVLVLLAVITAASTVAGGALSGALLAAGFGVLAYTVVREARGDERMLHQFIGFALVIAGFVLGA